MALSTFKARKTPVSMVSMQDLSSCTHLFASIEQLFSNLDIPYDPQPILLLLTPQLPQRFRLPMVLTPRVFFVGSEFGSRVWNCHGGGLAPPPPSSFSGMRIVVPTADATFSTPGETATVRVCPMGVVPDCNGRSSEEEPPEAGGPTTEASERVEVRVSINVMTMHHSVWVCVVTESLSEAALGADESWVDGVWPVPLWLAFIGRDKNVCRSRCRGSTNQLIRRFGCLCVCACRIPRAASFDSETTQASGTLVT